MRPALEETARRLWDARRLGTTVDAATVSLPMTQADALAIQQTIVRLSGVSCCGYKVGSTSKEAQRKLGTDEPGAGVLLTPFVHASPATLVIAAAHMPEIEGEFAFRMASDLPPRAEPYMLEDVRSAIASVAGAIEAVGTRFSGGLAGKGRLLTTADGGVNIALATGAWAQYRGQDLRDHKVAMAINGMERGCGTGSRALGDPLNVLVWLANHLSARGLGLKAGEIVSTGTCTGLDAVRTGDVARANFGDLGIVEIAFI